ncbi:hypothetical protein GPECTOR_3g410 [Gonium pectorale]|uniref:Plastid lipid-associated protein/fibrillin conserved domain-containing protein n=1 Tax=Gonium pectorale TaxID=33097 RepID=A0A150GZR6_GONPE|nr:hypothetical protein GPECTOR_3g410 [Gonium pectorale]|eukprot:KXZ55274.1 hypothetical protein GPECTOR_3g410 [Gonium pectorale]
MLIPCGPSDGDPAAVPAAAIAAAGAAREAGLAAFPASEGDEWLGPPEERGGSGSGGGQWQEPPPRQEHHPHQGGLLANPLLVAHSQSHPAAALQARQCRHRHATDQAPGAGVELELAEGGGATRPLPPGSGSTGTDSAPSGSQGPDELPVQRRVGHGGAQRHSRLVAQHRVAASPPAGSGSGGSAASGGGGGGRVEATPGAGGTPAPAGHQQALHQPQTASRKGAPSEVELEAEAEPAGRGGVGDDDDVVLVGCTPAAAPDPGGTGPQLPLSQPSRTARQKSILQFIPPIRNPHSPSGSGPGQGAATGKSGKAGAAAAAAAAALPMPGPPRQRSGSLFSFGRGGSLLAAAAGSGSGQLMDRSAGAGAERHWDYDARASADAAKACGLEAGATSAGGFNCREATTGGGGSDGGGDGDAAHADSRSDEPPDAATVAGRGPLRLFRRGRAGPAPGRRACRDSAASEMEVVPATPLSAAGTNDAAAHLHDAGQAPSVAHGGVWQPAAGTALDWPPARLAADGGGCAGDAGSADSAARHPAAVLCAGRVLPPHTPPLAAARRRLTLYTWAIPRGGPPALHSTLPLETAQPASMGKAAAAPPPPQTRTPLAASASRGDDADGGLGQALRLLMAADGSPALLLTGGLEAPGLAGNALGGTPGSGGAGQAGRPPDTAATAAPAPPRTLASGRRTIGSGATAVTTTAAAAAGSANAGSVQLLSFRGGAWALARTLGPPPEAPGGPAGQAPAMRCLACTPCGLLPPRRHLQQAAPRGTDGDDSAAARERTGGGAAAGAEEEGYPWCWQVAAAGEAGHGAVWHLGPDLDRVLQASPLPQARYRQLALNDVSELVVLPHRPRLLLGASSDGCVVLWDVGRLRASATPSAAPAGVCAAAASAVVGRAVEDGCGNSGTAPSPPPCLLTVARPAECLLRCLQPVAAGRPGRLGGGPGANGAPDAGATARDETGGGDDSGAEETLPGLGDGAGRFAALTRDEPVAFLARAFPCGYGVEAAGRGPVDADGGADGSGKGRVVPVLMRQGGVDLGQGMPVQEVVAVEGFQGAELDYSRLAGKWKLVYTTASDVLPILEAEFRLSAGPFSGFGLPKPLVVGDIYQRFTSPEEGVVENIINFDTPLTSVTFTVGARYDVRSGKRIALVFEDARLGELRISEAAETLLAPALLPRGSLQHMLLLAIREFQLRFQFRTAAQLASQAATGRDNIAAGYLLTYLDEDMLIGRAIGLGGTFVFVREE